MSATTSVELPKAFQFLFEPSRYKVAYGGRGGAKSWAFARALLIIGAKQTQRILCAREIQKTIADSVHKLLADQIAEMNLGGVYTVQQTKIFGPNGTEFSFAGLRHNVGEIKSYEGVDKVWVEEAHSTSDNSWNVLIPTIRKEGSEIWISFNPELEDDPTYKRFVRNPPANAVVRKVLHSDNPWFPKVLQDEMADLKERNFDQYLNVWMGECKSVLDGAIYANEMRQTKDEGRITTVPYDKQFPVHCFWDLGWGDATAIWCVQHIGQQYRMIDYIEDTHRTMADYVAQIQSKGYALGTMFLPHDASHKNVVTGKSAKEVVDGFGLNTQIVTNIALSDGINAARSVFNRCVFDETKCADGIRALSHYQYAKDEDRQVYGKTPLHNFASHGADAFRYMAVMDNSMGIGAKAPKIQYRSRITA